MYEDYQKIRESKGFSDSDVAKACGFSKSTISDWKNGRANPKLDKLIAIAKFLDVPLVKITGEDEDLQDYYIDKETRDLAEFLHKNPEYQVLFDASRKVKPDDIKKALKAIGLFIEE